MPFLPVNGAELYYEDTEEGAAPILFSHGLLWSLRMYDAQVKHLRGRYRCVAYDHRGQGQSRDDGSPYDMERLTEDAVQLIERLGIAPCFFVGLSMGGFVGLRLAAQRPELLRGLVLIESAADGAPWSGRSSGSIARARAGRSRRSWRAAPWWTCCHGSGCRRRSCTEARTGPSWRRVRAAPRPSSRARPGWTYRRRDTPRASRSPPW